MCVRYAFLVDFHIVWLYLGSKKGDWMPTKLKTRNGIPQLDSGYRCQCVFHTSETLLREIREMASRTGLSQRAIIEAGVRRQLSELTRQLNKGKIPIGIGDISDEE